MGCDIHFVVEFFDKEKKEWWGALASDMTDHRRPLIPMQRNYAFFGELAGVRGNSTIGNKPNGIPEAVSDLSQRLIEKWDTDGHSHSALSLDDFCKAYLAAQDNFPTGHEVREEYVHFDLFGIDFERWGSPEDCRIVFWFDN